MTIGKMIYIEAFVIAGIITMAIGWCVYRLALKYNLLDFPDRERKRHEKPTPLLGGVAIFASWGICLLFFALLSPLLLSGGYEAKHLIGLAAAGLILMIGGYLDDRFNIKPRYQIWFPILAALVIIASGIGVKFVTNPLGGIIRLDQIKIQLLTIGGIPYFFTLFADIFTLGWLLAATYAFKLLDGVDGLAASVGLVGSIMTFFVSLSYPYHQPDAALIAIILAGALVGFLIWNLPPAKMFLGDGGSLFIGFTLGILAILSGSKIATALLIIAFPLVDVVYVIFRRIFVLKKSPFQGDREHLHFRLIDFGFSRNGVVLIFTGFAVLFGLSTLIFSSFQKAVVLIILFVFAFIFELFITRKIHLKKQRLASK